MSDIKLTGFDDQGDDADFDLRPARKKSGSVPTSKKPASKRPDSDPETKEDAPTPAAPRAKRAPRDAPTKVSEQVEKMTASNLQVPASLIGQIKQVREAEGLTTGQLFIVAVEASYDALKNDFTPKSTGGSLFSSNSRKTKRPNKGPLAQQNFRMLSADIDVLDQLVEEFGLESRGHLVSEALERYFEGKAD